MPWWSARLPGMGVTLTCSQRAGRGRVRQGQAGRRAGIQSNHLGVGVGDLCMKQAGRRTAQAGEAPHLPRDGVLAAEQRHRLHLVPLVLQADSGLRAGGGRRGAAGPQLQLHRAGGRAHQAAKQLVLQGRSGRRAGQHRLPPPCSRGAKQEEQESAPPPPPPPLPLGLHLSPRAASIPPASEPRAHHAAGLQETSARRVGLSRSTRPLGSGSLDGTLWPPLPRPELPGLLDHRDVVERVRSVLGEQAHRLYKRGPTKPSIPLGIKHSLTGSTSHLYCATLAGNL